MVKVIIKTNLGTLLIKCLKWEEKMIKNGDLITCCFKYIKIYFNKRNEFKKK